MNSISFDSEVRDSINSNTSSPNTITHYVLDNNQIWSIAEAKFVSAVPEDAVAGSCPDEQGNSTVEGLIGCLEFYGYPKGELETEKDRAKVEIAELEEWLRAHDYIGTKIATGRATQEDYATEIAQMTAKAARVEELRAVLAE